MLKKSYKKSSVPFNSVGHKYFYFFPSFKMKIYYDIEIVTLLYQVSTEATQLGIYIYIYPHTWNLFSGKEKGFNPKKIISFFYLATSG